MKNSISVVITAFNEEKKIEEALESVKDIADEIIVINNNSTDKTGLAARKYTKKVFTQKNNPLDIDRQKNLGFSKATKEWILSLDADERVTPELAKEIQSVLSHESSIVGYWIPRKNIIFGKWIEHTGWYPDYQLRLFRNGQGKYTKEHVHEDIMVDGQTAYLHTDIVHYNFDSIEQFVSRNMLNYAKNEAKAKLQKGYEFNFFDTLWFPAKEFMSRFFAREGYKDGFHGLVLSLLMAAYHLAVFLYIWEEKGFLQNDIKLLDFEKQSTKIGKEVMYWLTSSKISSEKNLIKKTILKAKRKYL